MKSPPLFSFRIIISILLCFLFFIFSGFLVSADGEIESGNVTVNITKTCYPPEIHIDSTARGWTPSDPTGSIANYYGIFDAGGKYNCSSNYDRYMLPERQNYVFQGEKLHYYVIVRDLNGADDINKTSIIINDTIEHVCAEVDFNSSCGVPIDAGSFGIDGFNATIDKTYICELIVGDSNTTKGRMNVSIISQDECNSTSVRSFQTDLISFNPSVSLTLTKSSTIDFGTVAPGTMATSNSIYIENNCGEGVVLDMYIASDNYFTDPTPNSTAKCPTGNGIKYDAFSYYATKGSLNSGQNNARFAGLGAGDNNVDNTGAICEARLDEFTPLISYSRNIEDMCRIINWQRGASFLTQGAEMSITFRLDVPDECEGSFTSGQFHFLGKPV